MFNLRIISVCLGHTGVQIKRWVPLTSNLLKWKSKLHFHWDFQDNFLCQSILFSPTRPVWFGMIWFSSLLLSIPFLTLHCDPLCFLLGECVGIPPQEVAAASPSPHPLPPPHRNSAEPFTPLTQGRAGVCVWYTDVPGAAL